ncbi:MAG: toxin, BrnA family [Methyloprofundus sp.]|nr:MAG: toxin, BrnA family [Methyloprofundus sp.]
MKKLEFEWDNNKDKVNISKHGVSFDEAQTAFYDEYAIQFFDPEHSESEDRFLLLGTSFKLKTIVVCHCFREEEAVIRIISARKADKDEAKAYWSERE